MSETFFISDLHFGHKNILAFDNRPFLDIETHDKHLISRWNNTVGMTDDVWILGDISWYGSKKTLGILEQLNGIKHLIRGNHDVKILKNKEVQNQFVEIVDYKELKVNGHDVVLCHYPIPCFNNHYYGAFHLYGHVHTSYEWNMMEYCRRMSEELYGKTCYMYNAGCMVPYMGYTPRTLDEIIEGYARWKQEPEQTNGYNLEGLNESSS